jgi:hypothetical protein
MTEIYAIAGAAAGAVVLAHCVALMVELFRRVAR